MAQQEDLWQLIDKTTWFYNDNWAGQSLVFYQNYSGHKMALWQILGSGVYVTLSWLFDVEIQENRIILTQVILPYRNLVHRSQMIFIYNKGSDKIVSEDSMVKLTLFSSKAITLNRRGEDILEQLKKENYDNIDSL